MHRHVLEIQDRIDKPPGPHKTAERNSLPLANGSTSQLSSRSAEGHPRQHMTSFRPEQCWCTALVAGVAVGSGTPTTILAVKQGSRESASKSLGGVPAQCGWTRLLPVSTALHRLAVVVAVFCRRSSCSAVRGNPRYRDTVACWASTNFANIPS